MKITRLIYWTVFISLISNNLYSFIQNEETFVRHIALTEGFGSHTIYDLYVDHTGLLFLGTDKGLVSYNGVLSKNYSFQDNLALSINKIQQDHSHTLWCKNFSDQIFYLENDTLRPYQPAQNLLKNQNENLVDFVFTEHQM
ncbi:MAG: hypothetical protein LAT51_07545, partial [Flavobacteriaceae bacterium]|nr:hypothetical protein [Flavobacteriaceae bacterium]